jgi:zona occludens toxin
VVEHQILPALKAGRTVVTNVPMQEGELTALGLSGNLVVFPVEAVAAEPHRIRDYVTAGSVFVLDEVWRLFPQGQQANKVPDEYKSLLAEHRHMVDESGNSTQIVFVVQDLANIGAFARRLVENTFVTTKLSYVGLSGSYRVDVFHGAQTGATPPVSNRLRMITGRYRKEIFKLYKSHTMAAAETLHGANEVKMDTRANIFKRPAFIVGAIAVPVMLWYSLHTFAAAFHKGTSPATAAQSSGGGSRSGAERAPAAGFASESAPRASKDTPSGGDIRVLLELTRGGLSPSVVVLLQVEGHRLAELPESACQQFGVTLRCLYKGSWYDKAGLVERGPSGPLEKR